MPDAMPAAQQLQQMLDRQQILDALVRLQRGADRSDRELFLTAFHPDAEIDVGGFAGGPDALYDWAEKLSANTSAEHHYLLNHHVELEGDVANTETYFIYVATPLEGPIWQAGGRYIDRFERRGGDWRIAFRYNMVEWSGKLADGGLPFDLGEKPNGRAARSKDDPSYRRPLVNLRPLTKA
jgi:hypothetical protein